MMISKPCSILLRNRGMATEFSNLFDRLPTDLIMHIIDKILDVKSLCICCSVSKLFAALVPQTRFVSVQITSTIGLFFEVPVWPPGIMDFLKKLGCVEYLTIQFSPIRIQLRCSGPLVRWNFDSSSFVLFAAENRIDDTKDNSIVVESTRKRMAVEYYHPLFGSVGYYLHHLTSRFILIKELLAVVPNLKNVLAVGSTEQKRRIVWEEDIDSMMLGDPVIRVKLWSFPSLKLPVLGCAMKDVNLISISHGFCTEKNPFSNTKYRELAMIMMKEYPHDQITLPLPPLDMTNFTTSRILSLLQSIPY